VPVPRLADGDCGAGRDFASITPDRRVQGCSFQGRGLPGTTSDEILAACGCTFWTIPVSPSRIR
jgi:hypothetical protein